MIFRIAKLEESGDEVLVTGYMIPNKNDENEIATVKLFVESMQVINTGTLNTPKIAIINDRFWCRAAEANAILPMLVHIAKELELKIRFKKNTNIQVFGKNALEMLQEVAEKNNIKIE